MSVLDYLGGWSYSSKGKRITVYNFNPFIIMDNGRTTSQCVFGSPANFPAFKLGSSRGGVIFRIPVCQMKNAAPVIEKHVEALKKSPTVLQDHLTDFYHDLARAGVTELILMESETIIIPVPDSLTPAPEKSKDSNYLFPGELIKPRKPSYNNRIKHPDVL